MKHAFIHMQSGQYPVALLCKVMGVSRSGYYASRWRKSSQRAVDNEKLVAQIRTIHHAKRQVYGSPRIHAELVKQGVFCGKNRVARLIQQAGIRAKTKRKYQVTTDSRHHLPVKENLLNRNFETTAPNRVWVADISYISTHEGWLYLAAILDLYSRRVVGWHMAAHMRTELVTRALEMAVKQRRPEPGLIHHSDRGSQYASEAYQNALIENGMLSSMSGKGDCWDKAPMESFFKTLKSEQVVGQKYRSREEARGSISEYIMGFYNPERLQNALGYQSPNEYEQTQSICTWVA
ncbi:Integrase catalytic domain-containing protein [Sulfidibacter corallicola]